MISLPQIHDPPPGEGCGTCTVCCDVMGVEQVSKPYYGRCIHLRTGESGAGERCGCAIYESRPSQCSEYRCAWHLGLLGPRLDRRPNESGLLVTLEPKHGKWWVDVYEARPGPTPADRIRFLAQQVMSSKRARHLTFYPEIRFFPYGSDIPVPWPISEIYPFDPPKDVNVRVKREGGVTTFAGTIRQFMTPTPRVIPP